MKRTATYLGTRYVIYVINGTEHILIKGTYKKTGHIRVTLADILPDGDILPVSDLTRDTDAVLPDENANLLSEEGSRLQDALGEQGLCRACCITEGGAATTWAVEAFTAPEDEAAELSKPSPGKTLVKALAALKGLRTSGYWPYASPAPCSTEVAIKKAIESAIGSIEVAAELHDSMFHDIKKQLA